MTRGKVDQGKIPTTAMPNKHHAVPANQDAELSPNEVFLCMRCYNSSANYESHWRDKQEEFMARISSGRDSAGGELGLAIMRAGELFAAEQQREREREQQELKKKTKRSREVEALKNAVEEFIEMPASSSSGEGRAAGK